MLFKKFKYKSEFFNNQGVHLCTKRGLRGEAPCNSPSPPACGGRGVVFCRGFAPAPHFGQKVTPYFLRSCYKYNFFILLFLLVLCFNNNLLYASSVVELEINSSMRLFIGDVEDSTKFDFSGGAMIQQSLFPKVNHKKVGFLLWGLDFNYFVMKNANASMKFFQLGLVGSFYFNNIYYKKTRRSKFYPHPLLRFHSGYNRAEMSSSSKNFFVQSGNHPFLGVGAGFVFPVYKGLNMKAIYLFDTHFFQDGYVFIHSFNITVAYQIPVR